MDASRLISRLRANAGLSQRELARLSGVPQPAIARLEAGRRAPTLATLDRLARAVGFELQVDFVAAPIADPLVEAFKRDIDRTLLQETLRKTVEERIRSMAENADFIREVRRAVRAPPLEEKEMRGVARLLEALHGEDVDFIIAGGVAARAHGSARITQDLDISYARNAANLDRVAKALRPFHPYSRGVPPGLPFEWSVARLRAGLNFTLTTDAGDIDLLGQVIGGGTYEDLLPYTITAVAFNREMRILDLPSLIRVKRASGQPRDLEWVAELEAIQEEIGKSGDTDMNPQRSS